MLVSKLKGWGVVSVLSTDNGGKKMQHLLEVMDSSREVRPMDREQTQESLIRHLIEESYEVIEAIQEGIRNKLKEELGD